MCTFKGDRDVLKKVEEENLMGRLKTVTPS